MKKVIKLVGIFFLAILAVGLVFMSTHIPPCGYHARTPCKAKDR